MINTPSFKEMSASSKLNQSQKISPVVHEAYGNQVNKYHSAVNVKDARPHTVEIKRVNQLQPFQQVLPVQKLTSFTRPI